MHEHHTLVVTWVDDEHVTVALHCDDIARPIITPIADLNHDEHGWDGIRAVLNAITALSDALGIKIRVDGAPNL